MAMTLQSLLEAEDQADVPVLLLQLDVSNAFCAINRQELLRELAEGAPPSFRTWEPLVRAFLCRDLCILTPTYVQQGAPDIVRVTCGVAQGDPLSSLLFASALTMVLVRSAQLGTDRTTCAFMDDMVLASKGPDMIPHYETVRRELRRLGLQVQPEKTVLLAAPSQKHLAEVVAAEVGCKISHSGLLICGQPLAPGEDDACLPYRRG